MSAAGIAKALGGHPSGGGYLVRCPLPSHGQGRGDRRPSLSVADGDGERLLVRCFAGCEPIDVLAELRRLGLDEKPDADRWGSDFGRKTYDVGRNPTDEFRRLGSADCRRISSAVEPDAAALALWRSSRLATDDSLVRLYLSRHRAFTGEIPPSIRYALGADYRPGGIRLPGMIAGVQRPDRKLVAVQVTYLRASDGAKAPVSVPRMTVGALGDGAVRLAPAGPTLGLCEGVETGLSAMAMTGVATWCALGAARMHRVWVPDGVREVIVFADADEPGQRAADCTAEVHTKAGRRVTIRTPIDHSDWNDVARSLAREDAA